MDEKPLFNERETELIAELNENPAFKALLRMVEQEIERLGMILTISNPVETPSVLAIWRATKRIYTLLRETPEICQQLLPQFPNPPHDINPSNYLIQQVENQKRWTDRLEEAHKAILTEKVQ